MALGLERGTVRLAPFSKEWKRLYGKERKLLCSLLDGIMVAIEHIGSTAIPNIPAKPIIDIAIALKSADGIQRCIEILPKHGYEYRGEYGLPGRHFFTKNSTHHLHVVVQGCPHWDRWLVFRDYLTQNAQSADDYSKLKQKLAEEFAKDRDTYTKSKGGFIVATVDRAQTERFTAAKSKPCS